MAMSIWKALTGALTIASVVRADVFQYSSGWSPGQEPTQAAAAPSSVPTFSPPPEHEKSSWTSLLTSGPIGSLLSRSGINATEKLAEAQEKSKLPWDERITMITDHNYEELIFNEDFETPEEEAQRVWLIIVCVIYILLFAISLSNSGSQFRSQKSTYHSVRSCR